MATLAANVRVSGPPNSNFLVGYPGISATLVSWDESALVTNFPIRKVTRPLANV